MLKNPITGEELPRGWKILPVDKIKSEEKYACVAGPFGSDISSKYFVEEGTPVIRGNNLTLSNDKFKTEGFVFVSKKQAQNYKGQHVKFNDLVFTCWGTIGQVGIIPKGGPFEEYIISNKQLKLRVNEEKVNPTFLYYYFSTKSMVKYINNIAIGAAVPGINLGLLKNLPVILPPKNEQDFIAEKLDYFFDLIENNNQRIKLLEEMAEEIYKEWFVRFRFPGYENSKFLDKEGNKVAHGTKGAIPEGWEKEKLDQYLDFEKGVEPGSKNYETECIDNNYVPFLRVGDLGSRDSNIFIKKELTKDKYVTRDDIIITLDGTVGKVAMGLEGCYSSGLRKIVFKSDLVKRSFAYFTLLSANIQGTIQAHAAGTTILHASSSIKFMRIYLPKENLLNKFEEVIDPMLDEILLLKEKNKILQETRDLLLPRLISGKLSVENLELEEKEN